MRSLLQVGMCLLVSSAAAAQSLPFSLPGTGQEQCYNDRRAIGCPSPGQSFYGQDAHYPTPAPDVQDMGDGTIVDRRTGLMWQRDFLRSDWGQAPAKAASSRVGGYSDWRVPTIKELYSLILFSGNTGMARPEQSGAPADARPYLSPLFAFEYPAQGRYIDAQYVSSTAYVGRTMGGEPSFFGVNFADGRIKAYPQSGGPGRRQWYLRLVRGNPDYGKNQLHDMGNGIIADGATGLMWTKADSGALPRTSPSRYDDGRLDWQEALAFCQAQRVGGYQDWRLPNAKQLQSLVDYSRSPDTSQSAALSPLFQITPIRDSDGKRDWPFFWTSTTHLDGPHQGDFAVYVAFGRAGGHMRSGGGMGMGGAPPPGGGMGMGGGPPPGGGMGMGGGPPPGGGMGMGGGPPPGGGMGMGGGMGAPQDRSSMTLMDVHGAGAQRSSPKSGDESRLPVGAGPQGDVLRIYNYARCVRPAE